MPAFSFEKISPPAARVASGPVPAAARKQRGVIVQMLDRFVEARVRRFALDEEKAAAASRSRPQGS